MVRSLEMTKVPRALLNERMRRLDTKTFSDQNDPMQQELWTKYMRLATAFIDDALTLHQQAIFGGNFVFL